LDADTAGMRLKIKMNNGSLTMMKTAKKTNQRQELSITKHKETLLKLKHKLEYYLSIL